MSPCTFRSGSILATSSIAVLHFGQPIASFRMVSDTTNLKSAPHIKTRECADVSSLQAKSSN